MKVKMNKVVPIMVKISGTVLWFDIREMFLIKVCSNSMESGDTEIV